VRLGGPGSSDEFSARAHQESVSSHFAPAEHVEDSDVACLSKEILGQLREEIDRSFNAEYSREEKR